MDKLYYTIGEVAEMIGENASLVRYWSNEFSSFLKVRRSSRGDRRYTKEDIELIKQIHFLVNTKGMTLDGVAKALKGDKKSVDRQTKVIDSLKDIREQLEEVKKLL
ncbi:MAG: MerR family transcriptional regulator [Bacteroidales bacterium]|nr:MerR family transcriptional regulator [Bacteroidales bacterium]